MKILNKMVYRLDKLTRPGQKTKKIKVELDFGDNLVEVILSAN